MNNPNSPCFWITEGWDEPGQLEELPKDINGIPPIGEPPRWSQGEIYSIRGEVGLGCCVLEEVVVAIVNQRAPKHKHPLHLRLMMSSDGRKEGEGNEESVEASHCELCDEVKGRVSDEYLCSDISQLELTCGDIRTKCGLY